MIKLDFHMLLLSELVKNDTDQLGRVLEKQKYSGFVLWGLYVKTAEGFQPPIGIADFLSVVKDMHYDYLVDADIPEVFSHQDPGVIRITPFGARYYREKTRKFI